METIKLQIPLNEAVTKRISDASEITGLSVQEIVNELENDIKIILNNLCDLNKLLLPITYRNLKSKRYTNKKVNYEQ